MDINNDHGFANTADGLTAEDHLNGYHFYGAYQVFHICKQCNEKRTNFGYSYGWYDTLICNIINIGPPIYED